MYYGIIEKTVWADFDGILKVVQHTNDVLNFDPTILKYDIFVFIFILTAFQVAKFVEIFELKTVFIDKYHLYFRKSWITSCYRKNRWRYLIYWIFFFFVTSWNYLCQSGCWDIKYNNLCLTFFLVIVSLSHYSLELLIYFFLYNSKKFIFLLNQPLYSWSENFIGSWLDIAI